MIKICCMKSKGEIDLAAKAGADMIGLVGPMPSGPGTLTLEQARDLAAHAKGKIKSVFLTSGSTGQEVSDELTTVQPDAVQLVRHVAPAVHEELKITHPEVERIQVIHVEGPQAVDLINSYGEEPDAFLLDSGVVATDVLGGTGQTHDWSISRACVDAAERPVLLAGGLRASNVAEAIATVRAAGLDLCSGVRTDDRLDADKLSAFMTNARAAL